MIGEISHIFNFIHIWICRWQNPPLLAIDKLMWIANISLKWSLTMNFKQCWLCELRDRLKHTWKAWILSMQNMPFSQLLIRETEPIDECLLYPFWSNANGVDILKLGLVNLTSYFDRCLWNFHQRHACSQGLGAYIGSNELKLFPHILIVVLTL